MKLVPENRLLVWLAVLIPFAILGALVPSTAGIAVALFLVWLTAAVLDAGQGFGTVRGITVSIPDAVRMSKDKPGIIPLLIQGAAGRVVRIGLPLHESFRSEADLLDVRVSPEHAEAAAEWPCTPTERGSFCVRRCYFETASPLGLWRARHSSPCRGDLRVYPNLLGERKRLAALFLNRSNFGIHTQRMIGQGRDFEKLREYIPGDSHDDIHWKATAKRGRPVTKLFQIERTQEIYVALDASRLSARRANGQPNLERMIASALTLGLVAQQQGDLFGMIAFSDRVRSFVRASGGKANYSACRDALYTVGSTGVAPDYQEFFSFVRLRMRRRALVCILTDLSDPILSESFLEHVELICRQHLVIVAMIRPEGVRPLFSSGDAEDTDAIYRDLGGHMVWRSLRELEQSLRRRGVEFTLVDEARLAADLVTRYMGVKSRQAL